MNVLLPWKYFFIFYSFFSWFLWIFVTYTTLTVPNENGPWGWNCVLKSGCFQNIPLAVSAAQVLCGCSPQQHHMCAIPIDPVTVWHPLSPSLGCESLWITFADVFDWIKIMHVRHDIKWIKLKKKKEILFIFLLLFQQSLLNEEEIILCHM